MPKFWGTWPLRRMAPRRPIFKINFRARAFFFRFFLHNTNQVQTLHWFFFGQPNNLFVFVLKSEVFVLFIFLVQNVKNAHSNPPTMTIDRLYRLLTSSDNYFKLLSISQHHQQQRQRQQQQQNEKQEEIKVFSRKTPAASQCVRICDELWKLFSNLLPLVSSVQPSLSTLLPVLLLLVQARFVGLLTAAFVCRPSECRICFSEGFSL